MDILETKTDIGLIRETNEDKAIALMHPKNKNIKFGGTQKWSKSAHLSLRTSSG